MNDSSEPVESRITRTPGTGRSRRAWARATIAPTELRLSLAPGTTARAPMSAMAAVAPAEKSPPRRRSPALPERPPSAVSSGPRKTPNMIGMLWSAFSWRRGVKRMPSRGSAGWNTSPL